MPAPTFTLATELIAAWNAHDVDRVTALHAADYEGEDIALAHPFRSPADMHHHVSQYLTAFPDVHFTLQQVIQQHDQVAIAWAATGTHLGPLMHIPPTGRTVTVLGVWMLTVRDGQIHRSTTIWDVAGMLRTLRLLPQLRETSSSS